MRLPDLEPGSWADWVNALATILAFTVALVLFVIGLRDRRRANEDRRRADLDRLRDQARKVWIWPVSWTSHPSSSGRVKAIRYRISNDSDEPISNCIVNVQGDDSLKALIWDRSPDVHVLPARQVEEIEMQIAFELSLDKGFDPLSPGWRGPPLQLTFTDAAGVHWLRQSDGLLKRLS
jgi:hypothetical protein